MKIWAQTLVKNEERYVWFALMSAVKYVDKILVWDTGSTDNTVAIIKEVKRRYPEKIELNEVGAVDIDKFTEVRQEMLRKTKGDWMMILDGDEVWWEDSIRVHVELIRRKGTELESLVTPYTNLVGDIFHYQDESAGKYSIDGKTGNLTIRFNSMSIPGLTYQKPHGKQGLYDSNGNTIQTRPGNLRVFVDARFMHFTHLPRSVSLNEDLKVPKRGIKYKYEIGNNFALDYYYPEVFFRERPKIVASPWQTMTEKYYLRALVETPLRKIKRRFLPHKSGY